MSVSAIFNPTTPNPHFLSHLQYPTFPIAIDLLSSRVHSINHSIYPLWPTYSASNCSLSFSARQKVPHFRVASALHLHHRFSRRPSILWPSKSRICSSTASYNFLLSELNPPFILFSCSRPRRAPHLNFSDWRPPKSCWRAPQAEIFYYQSVYYLFFIFSF